MLSPSDTAIVFVLALLLFGPEQLPKLARQLGEAMRHIQSTTNTFMMEMDRAADAAQEHVHAPPTLEAPQAIEESNVLEANPETAPDAQTEIARD
jgi:sec-independent protein translocase protein TatB